MNKVVSKIILTFIKLKTYWQTSYLIEGYKINIPKRHSLPFYQSQYHMYDKFLPILVQHIPDNGTIVDVGANIGDTLFSTMFACKNEFLCVEGSDYFFDYLTKNISMLPKLEQDRITTYKLLVGTGKVAGELSHSSGRTATVDSSDNSLVNTHEKLDSVLKGSRNIALIKSDTDGFDWDVLLSATETIATHKPLLFWENEVCNDSQAEGYRILYDFLKKQEYSSIYVFDNFGNLILENVSINVLLSLNCYILSMNKGLSTRTLYYIDILAVTESKRDIAENAIRDFKETFHLG